MATAAERREARQASLVYHAALVAYGIDTLAESYATWDDVQPVPRTVQSSGARWLQAAMTALERKVGEFRTAFGESWERVFRLAAELSGIAGAVDDYETEVIWRDTNARAFTTVADGLLKLRQAGAPIEGLLALVPGMTRNMLETWIDLMEDEKEEQAEKDAQMVQAQSLLRNRAATSVGQKQQNAKSAQTGASKVP